MPARALKTILLAAAVAAVAGSVASAQTFSTDPLNRAERNRIILYGAPGDVQAIDRIQGRRDFQRQQQQFREQDRPLVRPQRLEVPRMKQNCRLRLFGSKFLSTCD